MIESFEWCNKAAEQGLTCAQNTLSIMYGRGLGTEQNTMKSEYWYRVANKLETAEDYRKAFFAQLKTLTDTYPVFDGEFDW